MSNLDDKLREILADMPGDHASYFEWSDDTIKRLKQAFAEDGYRQIPKQSEIQHLIDDGTMSPLMTGQEWYDRFEKEVNSDDWRLHSEQYPEKHRAAAALVRDLFLEAAKKASGIDNG